MDLRQLSSGRKTIVQCKHYAGSTFADLRNSARSELVKMDHEKPDKYLFVTSQNLNRTQKDTLSEELDPWLSSPADILTQLDLNELLGRHPEVERQHFKLWLASVEILERIVHSGLWARSEALIEDISDRVRLYVRTPKYGRAVSLLDKSHVVVLTGAPGVGKSLLAEMLLLAHWHKEWQVVSVSEDIDEAWNSWRRNAKQIFYYDDFLGQTDVTERGGKNEDSRIVRFMDRVRAEPTKRLVMTTRSQILRQATFSREPVARGNLYSFECVIEVTDYGSLEKGHILYNHLYFSNLPRQVLRDYVNGGHYWKVVEHQNFSPRIIEQVLRRDVRTAKELSDRLGRTLDRPIDLWGTMFATVLSEVARRIVLNLATFAVSGASSESVRLSARGDAQPIEYTQALRGLEGTFIDIEPPGSRRNPSKSELLLSFANPSVRDFVLATLDTEPDYALQLIEAAHSVAQIATLIQYAGSASGDVPKFPGLERMIRARWQIVARKLTELLSRGIQDAPNSRYPQSHIRTELLEPLVSILPYSPRLMSDFMPEMVEHSISLVEMLDYVPSAETLGNIAQAIVSNSTDNLEDVADTLTYLFGNWGISLETAEDVDAFALFLKNNSDRLIPHFQPREILMEHGPRTLLSEIENLSGNRHDEDSDIAWIESIEEVADKLDLADHVRHEIQAARESTYSHYGEREQDDPMPVSGAGYMRSAAPAERESRNAIEAIFRQLS